MTTLTITAHHVAPTDTAGSRYRATLTPDSEGTPRRSPVTLSADYTLDPMGNMRRVAALLAGVEPGQLRVTGEAPRGYTFAVDVP